MTDQELSKLPGTSARVLAKHLAKAGCKHAFGMPGGEVLTLLDALREVGVQFTLCKHENAAGFMAEGSWHATGAPGILLATVGPGLANGLNSVANAFQEQVPLIVLSGCIDASEAEQFTHQSIDQTALMKPITKASFRVAANTAAHVVQKALAVAMADPPGPVHIDLPVGLAGQEAVDVMLSSAVAARPGWPEGEALAEAASRLENAKRPIIVAGLGAYLHGASPELTRMAIGRNIPVVTTYKAKGVFDETHALALGGHGLSPLSDSHVLPLLDEADLVLLVGYDPIEMRSGWIQPWDANKVIELNHADVQHGMHGASMRVVGDVAALVRRLDGAASPSKIGVWPKGEPELARAALKRDFAARSHWGPHAVFDALAKFMPDNAVLTIDSGAHRILLSQMLECKRPGSVLQSSCFCTMGVAVPLATGYAIAAQETPVFAVVGDAGFDMSPGDLATLRDSGRPVTLVVLVDDSLALIEKKQKMMQLPSHGVLFSPTDIVAVAQAYGGQGIDVYDVATFTKELSEASKADTFTVLACHVDKEEYKNAF